MKTKKKNRKLEFKKETIARLGEGHMRGLYGGTDGGNDSIQIAGPCTVTQNKEAQATCTCMYWFAKTSKI